MSSPIQLTRTARGQNRQPYEDSPEYREWSDWRAQSARLIRGNE